MMQVDQAGLMNRAIRAFKADKTLFEEVEKAENLTQEAFIIVGIGAISTALGGAIGALMISSAMPQVAGVVIPRPGFVGTLISQLISTVVGYIVWSYATYFVGTRMFNGTATPQEMLRVIGYASTPKILGIVGFIPGLGGLIGLILWIWSIYLGFLAVRQGLNITTQNAILTIIISAIIAIVIGMIVGIVLAPLTLMGF
jgi:hypothetical protein